MTQCAGCKSEGFGPSLLGLNRCQFCDGTEGGVGPASLYEKFEPELFDWNSINDHIVSLFRSDRSGSMDVYSRFAHDFNIDRNRAKWIVYASSFGVFKHGGDA